MLGDWAGDPNKNFFSCDTCGLTPAENYELLKVGQDTLLGNYTNAFPAPGTGARPFRHGVPRLPPHLPP